MSGAREAQPSDRVRVEAWLRARGIDWPPGRGFLRLAPDGGITALARLVEPPPGDGHHREHVRTLVLAGDATMLTDCARLAAQAWPGRLEARAPSSDTATSAALSAAGLEREVALTRGWAERDRLVDLHLWGRGTGPGDRSVGRLHGPVPRTCPRDLSHVRWHDHSTRPMLERFLAALVPGRAYPPGTLLSEAERVETSRPGLLDAPWLLALDDSATTVLGVLAFERESVRERAHVRRVHLDVAPAAQRRGVATALLGAARADSRAKLGALVLEADPRAGNAGACGALAAAGFERVGIQRGAWRLKQAGRGWDEDVVLFRCDAE